MISGATEEELELASARMDIMLATNYTPDNQGPLAIIDKYYDKEINRLNNIIDELEKWLKEQIDYLTKIDGQNIPLKDGFEFCSMNELYQTGKYSGLKDSIEKLQELKGSENNG